MSVTGSAVRAARARARRILPGVLYPPRYLARQVIARTGLRVLAGPFAGLRYIDRAVGPTPYLPKLLGLYEKECGPCLEEALALPIDRVVNVGAAEGFYAVGLAVRLPKRPVVAFETNEAAHPALRELAELNGVGDWVDVRGICDAALLEASLAGSALPLVVCDIEGGEAALCDPGRVPALARAFILVETHDCFVLGVHELLRSRFAATHDVVSVPGVPRTDADYPFHNWFTRRLPALHLATVIGEYRPSDNM